MSNDLAHARSVLVYGGSFDPPHWGHLHLPSRARALVGADHVLYIPANLPPHKSRTVTPAEHRLAMLQLAIGNRRNVSISRIELDRPGRSFTIDTLRALRNQLGSEVRLLFLMGTDMAMTFDQWKNPQGILELAEPVVMMRPPMTRKQFNAALGKEWADRVIGTWRCDISSSELRAALADAANRKRLARCLGRRDRYTMMRSIEVIANKRSSAMKAKLLAYILDHDLYRTS